MSPFVDLPSLQWLIKKHFDSLSSRNQARARCMQIGAVSPTSCRYNRQLVGNKLVFRSFNLDFKGLGLATQSVLAKLPAEDGKQVMCWIGGQIFSNIAYKQVVASVVGNVAANLGMLNPAEAKPSPLQTEQVLKEVKPKSFGTFAFQEVNWCMEVICHGLCLPLEDHMIIRWI